MRGQDLINALDNEPSIVLQKFDGFLIWPTLRFIVIQHLIDKTNNLDNARGIPISVNIKYKLKGVYNAFIYCPFFGPNKPLLILNSATSNIKSEDGNFYNRIVDYFFCVDKNRTWKIEEAAGFLHNRPHTYKAYSSLSFIIYSKLYFKVLSLFNKRKVQRADEVISELINNINETVSPLGIQFNNDNIRLNMLKYILKLRPYYHTYKLLFSIKHVKNIIIEDGHYGLEKAVIIKAAKDCGIYVLEPQHGFVNENHPCYNYGDGIMTNDEYKRYIPDIFLCYGEFWTNNIRIPNSKYAMGNPHLESALAKVAGVKTKKEILVIGSGVTILETNKLLNALLQLKPVEYDLLYRPHPQERSEIENRYGQVIEKGVRIDKRDLYESMAKAEIIIGELTTVIFEAVALEKVVFLYNSSYTQAYLNDKIKYFKIISLDNLSVIFKKETLSDESVKYYWKKGWLDAYNSLRELKQI